MKVLIDMNLSPKWVALLVGEGFEAAHWSTIGPASAPDLEIMAFAKSNDFIVLTHDLDFSALLAANKGEKPSVVQIRSEDLGLTMIGSNVIAALRQMTRELEQGSLITVDPNRTRIRLLPL